MRLHVICLFFLSLGSDTSPFTPTILVEMYTNFVPLPDESDTITTVILASRST